MFHTRINTTDYPSEKELSSMPWWIRATYPSREYMNKRQRKRDAMRAYAERKNDSE